MRSRQPTPEFTAWGPVAIPPRSRLYHMPPAGLGTGLVESATGYSSRLALAHCVTPAVLFGYEIAPLLGKNHLRNSEARSNKNAVLSNSFRSLAPAVDGHGSIAETYVASLGKLTLRGDLRPLAMLPWREVISHRQLTRPRRAWCPACYDGWRRDGTPAYEPLLWSLTAVTACAPHRRLLRTRCRRCGHEPRPLASRSRPGHCPGCQEWLGEPARAVPAEESLESLAGAELESRRWVHEQVSDLLAAAPALTTQPSRRLLAESVSRRIRASPFGTEQAFARHCGLSQSSVNDLCRGASAPQLSTLLKIAFFCGCSLMDLILGRTTEPAAGGATARQRAVGDQRTAKSGPPPQRWTEGKAGEVRQGLLGLLDVDHPLPMVEIARRLNHHASTLLSNFPDLSEKAVARHKAHAERGRRRFWGRVRKTLERQLGETEPMSVAQVARAAGRSRTAVVRRFPELSAELSAQWVKRREGHWARIEESLQSSLEDDPPRHLREIAKRLGLSHTGLYKHFPRLCRKIAERHAAHMRQGRALKKESLRIEVSRVARDLCARGIYPSVREVQKHLSRPLSLRNSKVALDSLRDVRRASCLRPGGVYPSRSTAEAA